LNSKTNQHTYEIRGHTILHILFDVFFFVTLSLICPRANDVERFTLEENGEAAKDRSPSSPPFLEKKRGPPPFGNPFRAKKGEKK